VQITELHISGTASVGVTEFPLTHREFNGTPYSFSAATIEDVTRFSS
jgi:hypothetical protein